MNIIDTFQDAAYAAPITNFQDSCLRVPNWARALTPRYAQFDHSCWKWIEINHRYNSLLWDEEDLARRRHVADAEIAANKRAIDSYNQSRNDAVERFDDLLLLALKPYVNHHAPLHAETAGMMVDRLSILSLKINAMAAQTMRTDVDESHREKCRERLHNLHEQRTDLAGCLDTLIADCVIGHGRYKSYRQYKMYNDAALNPQLYKRR